VARAKATDRAEARRRYRQTTAQTQGSETDEAIDDAEGDDAAPKTTAKAAASAAPSRPGIGAAFRNAYRPANLREDLAFLPKLVLGRAFLAGVGLMVAGTALFIVQPTTAISSFVFQTVVLPPALAPVFIVGFFAPRASYLLGLIIGIVNAALYAIVIASVAPDLAPGTDVSGQVTIAVLTSPLSGLLFASAAAWYRRFLQATSPRRNAPTAKGAKGRARTSGSASKR